jgi:hypothetical protein
MIYIIFEVSGEIKGVTVNRTSTTQIEVSNSFFEEYPQGCWEVVDEEVTLKADADDIRTAFLASIEETVTLYLIGQSGWWFECRSCYEYH